MSSQHQQKNTNMGKVLVIGSELGVLIALPMVACIIAGIYLDKRFGSFPWMLLLFIFLGLVLTVVDVYKLIIPFLEKRTSTTNFDSKEKK
ncbi:MAG: AtpZ/AtpI family protein [Candidatus Pacebacteria bacterium]|nr:AtpZ/AtpI family protein [Candidatus Paceibacterota bacterium]